VIDGSVSVVREEGSKRKFALKLIEIKDPLMADQLEDEARFMPLVNHISVIKMLREPFKSKREIGILLPLALGSLADFVKLTQKTPTIRLLLTRLLSTAEGLEAIHGAGLIHGDITLANILISNKEGNVVISNFGDTQKMTAKELMAGVGTIGARAPELRANKPFNWSVDIYALGLTIFEYKFRVRPTFVHEKQETKVERKTNNKEVDELLISLLATNPAERPSANAIVQKTKLLLSKLGREEVNQYEIDDPKVEADFLHKKIQGTSRDPYAE